MGGTKIQNRGFEWGAIDVVWQEEGPDLGTKEACNASCAQEHSQAEDCAFAGSNSSPKRFTAD
jgi:hypothetical protein